MKNILLRVLAPLCAVCAIVGLDQVTKYLTIQYLSDGNSIVIIKNVLELVFVKNEGMAWGMLQQKQWLFIILTPIAVAGLIYLFYRAPFEKRFLPFRIAEIMLMGGAIGNLIDRCFRCEGFGTGYVVDMIYFKLIDFPVFNVADSFITIAFVLLIALVIFYYKDEDFDRILGKKSKKREFIDNEDN